MNKTSEEQNFIIENVKQNKNVVVDACAGSGKSTTILSTALQLSHLRFLLITYNSSLRKEMKEKIKELDIHNVTVHTYHSLAVNKYDPRAHTDSGIRQILYKNTQPSSPVKPQDIIVLDEAQDMTLLYFTFVLKFVKDMNHKFQLMVLGDYMQGLYEFKGSDIRFLTLAQDLWQGFSLLQTQDFENCTLKMSYRITNEMAAYVNDVMLGEQRVNACRAGPTVYYMRDSTRNLQILVGCRIKELIQQGVPPSDIFVLGASVKGENSQIRKIENVLTNAHIPCYVPMMEDAKIDEKVIEGKVVFSTFHCVKGRQRPYVFVVGFDQSYMSYFARNMDQTRCPNTLYVATTRATQRLFLLESDQFVEDRPLKFLKKDHHEMMALPYIEFKGRPQRIFYEQKENQDENTLKKHKTTPTDLIKFIPEHILEEISPILDQIFVVEREKQETIDIPTTIKTKRGFYEDVSDLNGIAIPTLYYDYLLSKWQGSESNILYEMIVETVDNMRANEHTYLKQLVEELDPVCSSIDDYLYLANLSVAVKEKLYFKIKQIDRDEYNWLGPDVLASCKKRLLAVLGPECDEHEPDIEKTIINALNDEDHIHIDECLKIPFPNKQIRFTGRIDIMTHQTLWEIKCTSELSQDHLLQLVIYAWIMRTKDPTFSKQIKLFNVKTGEVLRLECEKTTLDQIMFLLLEGKYGNSVVPNDENFVENCRKHL